MNPLAEERLDAVVWEAHADERVRWGVLFGLQIRVHAFFSQQCFVRSQSEGPLHATDTNSQNCGGSNNLNISDLKAWSIPVATNGQHPFHASNHLSAQSQDPCDERMHTT